MNLGNVQTIVQFEIWVVPIISGNKIKDGLVFFKPTDISGEYNIIQNGSLIRVKLKEKQKQNDLDFHLKRGCACLAEIILVAGDNSAFVKVVFFIGEVIELGDIEVGFDERIVTTAKKQGFRFKDNNELSVLLSERCLLNVGGGSSDKFFIIKTGSAADNDFENIINVNTPMGEEEQSDDEEDELPSSTIISSNIQIPCFSIYGERLKIPVEKRRIDSTLEIFYTTKLISSRTGNVDGSLRLAKGNITFSDYTKTGRIRALASGAMMRLLEDKGSYLKKWDEYGAIEGEFLLARAKAIGKLEYSSTIATRNGIKFFFVKNLPEALSEGDELEITSEEPIYLSDYEIDWKQFNMHIENDYRQKLELKKFGLDSVDDNKDKPILAKVINLQQNSFELKLKDKPAEGKFMILSINGDKVQIERRMKARELILQGKSANPLLGMLIEENGEIPEIQRISSIEPISPFIKNKIFKKEPTDVQIKAIDIAINTPDIALIQGPPGTGKTTVITAIIERLNELHDKSSSIRGKILVSGYQHDAVDNIVSRLSINALPAVKFGGRSNSQEYSDDTSSKRMRIWCEEIADKVREKNPKIIHNEEQRKLYDLFILYSKSPSNNNARGLIKLILNLPRNILLPEIVENASRILDVLDNDMKLSNFTNNEELRTIRSLRISEVGFKDDGRERVIDILEGFENILREDEKKLIRKAVLWEEGKDLEFLKGLKKLKQRLLEIFTPKPQFRIEKPREDIIELFSRVSMLLDKSRTAANKRELILAEFLHELEDNPDGVRRAIEDYNYVFAATTQQAEGSEIRFAKTKFKNELLSYDTVIIDEAARTSPRDLMIPMCQAEKRIILVGDHRQLPHMIDEEVVKALEAGKSIDGSKANNDFIKNSMFYYLFNRLKKLEQKDKIPRTITLDAQYRMHPILGDFVNQNFYAKYPKEGFSSPLPEEYFQQELEDTMGRPAVWLNVPHKKGKEEKIGTSHVRVAEAEEIASKLNYWIKSEEGKELTFGIISFYKAQVNLIYKELSKYNITEKDSEDNWDIAEEYKYLQVEKDGKIEERIRIGTVDAFQGMEFDVVFLSIVRSQNMTLLPPYIRDEQDSLKKINKLFGHLISENRLCVSMSRQKKILVVVGDSEFICDEMARTNIPALYNYYKLCKEKGIIL